MTVTRKQMPIMYNYHMNGTQLERCDNMRDLGVIINNKLTWKDHINSLVSKANRVMGLIKRMLGFNAPVAVNKQLYTSLVRGILEYGTPVWSGMTVHDTIRTERIQRAATKFILHYPDTDYRERLMQLHMLPLTSRREYLDLSMFHKYCNGLLLNVNAENYVTFLKNNIVTTRNNEVNNKVCIPLTKTVACQKTFFVRIAFLWNSLSNELRSLEDIKLYKRELYKMFLNHVDKYFKPDIVCTWHLICRCNNCRLI